MVRIENTAKQALAPLLNYIDQLALEAGNFLLEIEQTDPPLDATYQNGRETAAKNKAKNLVKMLRWYLDKFNLQTPTTFTDVEVDVIDKNIRTHEEP